MSASGPVVGPDSGSGPVAAIAPASFAGGAVARPLLRLPDDERDTPSVYSVPRPGTGTFTRANGGTPVMGDGRRLVTYAVQIEGGIPGWTPESFATEVDRILADTRSWRASHRWSFRRVPPRVTPDLSIRLATPGTVQRLCGRAGIHTLGKYSCRYGRYVMINLIRWTYAVPAYANDIPAYRAMVTNHEVGHFLDHRHVACPGTGKLAPVMQTQTIALNGCLPNPWPYPDGVHVVSGPAAPA